MINASTIWSAAADMGSADITVGLAMTDTANRNSFVPATTAALAASPSGCIKCIAKTPAMAGQHFVGQVDGPLDPSEAPLVGPGAIEYVVVDTLGRLVRSAVYTDKVIGIAGLDGSVILALSGWNGLGGGGGGGGTSGILSAIVDYAAAAGDVLITANHASDPTRMTKATTAALAAGFMPAGVALITVPVLNLVFYAAVGSTVAASIVGFTPGAATWAIVDGTTGRLAKKSAPRAFQVVMGATNSQGNVLILPYRPQDDAVRPTRPPYNAKTDLSADAAPAINQASIDATLTLAEMQMNLPSRPLVIDGGAIMINQPVHIKVPGQLVDGMSQNGTHLRAMNYCGPAFYVGPDVGPFPTVAAAFAGGNAAILDPKGASFQEHYLILRNYGAGTEMHGKTAFSIEMWVAIDPAAANGEGFIFSSYGARLNDDPLAFAYGVEWAGSAGTVTQNAFYCTLTTSVRVQTVCTPTNSMPKDGVYRRLLFKWNGTVMTCEINGVNQTLSVASGSPTIGGTIVQKWWETPTIGGAFSFWGAARTYVMCKCFLASLRMSDIARTDTPAVAKFGEDANTTLLVNFDTFSGPFVVSRSRGNVAASTLYNTYFPHQYNDIAIAAMNLVSIQNFAISNTMGPAIDVNRGVSVEIKNIRSESCKCGIILDQNSFKAGIENVDLQGSSLSPRCGISAVGAANVISIQDAKGISNFCVGVVLAGAGDVGFVGRFYTTICFVHMWVATAFNINMAAENEFSDEASTIGGKLPEYYIILQGVDKFVGLATQPSQSESTCPLIVVQGDGTIGPCGIEFITPFVPTSPSSSGMFHVPGAAPAGTIVLHSPSYGTTPAVPVFTSTSAVLTRIISHPQLENGESPIAMPDANRTLTRREWLNGTINFAGTLTAGRTVTCPAAKCGRHVLINGTNQTLTFIAAGGIFTIAVTTGTAITVDSTGAELYRTN